MSQEYNTTYSEKMQYQIEKSLTDNRACQGFLHKRASYSLCKSHIMFRKPGNCPQFLRVLILIYEGGRFYVLLSQIRNIISLHNISPPSFDKSASAQMMLNLMSLMYK